MTFDWPTPPALRTLGLIIATVAASVIMAWTIASSVQSSRTAAEHSSQVTLQQTESAIQQQQRQFQAALLGECNGRNAVTRQLNVAHEIIHHVLSQAAVLTAQGVSNARRASPKTRSAYRSLARDYAADARRIRGVTETDCAQELLHPLTYQQPHAKLLH